MPTTVPDFKARSVVWTLNNYTEEDVKVLRAYGPTVKYLVWGYEKAPLTGTPHLQGFVCWENPRAVGRFCKMFSQQPHVEAQMGTHVQASNYCKYEDYPDCKVPNKFEEFGTLPRQGERIDWKKALDDLKEGKSVLDVIEEQPHMGIAQRSLREIKAMMLKPCHREVNVIVLFGGAGTGKTRYAYDNYPDIYSKPRGEWWDGYTGQKQILLDDYYGYLPYCELLRVLDRYPYQVPIKGGFVQAQWDTVVITSNEPPERWYKTGMTPALRRRLNKIILLENIDGLQTQTNYSPPD